MCGNGCSYLWKFATSLFSNPSPFFLHEYEKLNVKHYYLCFKITRISLQSMSNWCTKVVKLNIPLSRLNEGLVLFTAEPCSMKVMREFRLVGIVWSENLLQKKWFCENEYSGNIKGHITWWSEKRKYFNKISFLGEDWWYLIFFF